MEVLHRDLPGAAAAAAACLRRHLVCAPAERLELDLVLVLGVPRLACDPVDLQKVVDCHCSPPGAERRSAGRNGSVTLPRVAAPRRAGVRVSAPPPPTCPGAGSATGPRAARSQRGART